VHCPLSLRRRPLGICHARPIWGLCDLCDVLRIARWPFTQHRRTLIMILSRRSPRACDCRDAETRGKSEPATARLMFSVVNQLRPPAAVPAAGFGKLAPVHVPVEKILPTRSSHAAREPRSLFPPKASASPPKAARPASLAMHSRSAFRLKPDPPLPPQKICRSAINNIGAPLPALFVTSGRCCFRCSSLPPAGVCAGRDAPLLVGRPAACARVTRCFSTGAFPLLLLVPLRPPPLAHAGTRGEGRGRGKREECSCDVHNFF
jgi:hypothetical protein